MLDLWHAVRMGPQQHYVTMAKGITASSAMNPTLLLCLMVCPVCFIGAISLAHFGLVWPAGVAALIGGWPLGIAGWQLIRFTKYDPDRLQQEQHVQNMTQIRNALAVKDGGELREVTVSDILTSNPQLGGPADE